MAEQETPSEAKQDAPAGEAPKAEAPKAEAPKAEAPKAEAPKAEAPKAKAPKTEAPKAEAPKAEAPKAEEPKAEATEGEAPAEAPEPEPEPEPLPAIAPLPEGKHYIWGTGRRKKSIARVRIRPGTGKFLVNKRDAAAYFNHERDRQAIAAPLRVARMVNRWDIWVNVKGGGYTGQAGAVVLGLARALSKAMPDVEGSLRDQGFMTRDARMSERKKPGQPGARKRFQFSKR